MQITPRDVYGAPQWAGVVVAYCTNFVVIFFLWWNYRKVLALRRVYFESDEYQSSLHARTLMVRHSDSPPSLPPRRQGKRG